jgi:hypothetical protein
VGKRVARQRSVEPASPADHAAPQARLSGLRGQAARNLADLQSLGSVHWHWNRFRRGRRQRRSRPGVKKNTHVRKRTFFRARGSAMRHRGINWATHSTSSAGQCYPSSPGVVCGMWLGRGQRPLAV